MSEARRSDWLDREEYILKPPVVYHSYLRWWSHDDDWASITGAIESGSLVSVDERNHRVRRIRIVTVPTVWCSLNTPPVPRLYQSGCSCPLSRSRNPPDVLEVVVLYPLIPTQRRVHSPNHMVGCEFVFTTLCWLQPLYRSHRYCQKTSSRVSTCWIESHKSYGEV